MRTLAIVFLAVLAAGCMGPPAPPPGTGEAFEEKFDDPSHAVPGWENRGGRWDLVDEHTAPSQPHVMEQTRNSTSPSHYVATGPGTFDAVEIEVRFRFVPGAAKGAGIVFRAADAENYYVAWTEGAGGVARLEEYRGGNGTELARTSQPLGAQAEWGRLTVRAEGTEFTVSVDGSQQGFTASDATLSVGHVGLWTPSGSRAQFDDVVVRRL